MKLHYYSVLLISFFACQSGSQTIETPSEQATEIDTYSDTSETLDLTDEIIKLPEIDLNKNYIADILRLGRIESIDSLDLDNE